MGAGGLHQLLHVPGVDSQGQAALDEHTRAVAFAPKYGFAEDNLSTCCKHEALTRCTETCAPAQNSLRCAMPCWKLESRWGTDC